jgi:hypothetical protein
MSVLRARQYSLLLGINNFVSDGIKLTSNTSRKTFF